MDPQKSMPVERRL